MDLRIPTLKVKKSREDWWSLSRLLGIRCYITDIFFMSGPANCKHYEMWWCGWALNASLHMLQYQQSTGAPYSHAPSGTKYLSVACKNSFLGKQKEVSSSVSVSQRSPSNICRSGPGDTNNQSFIFKAQ